MEEVQKDAAGAPEGPLVIMGGSGTGKSTTLENRSIELVKAGADPNTISIITFNARAATRIRQEMGRAIGADPIEVGFFIGTLHKYCSIMLRQSGWRYAGISPSFSICDSDQSIAILTELSTLKDENNRTQGQPTLKQSDINAILQWISYNLSVRPENQRPPREPMWQEYANAYEIEKRRQNLVDFNDLLLLTRDVFRQNRNLRDAYNNIRSRNVIIDEFQDHTPLNYEIIKMMIGPTRSITVALDPNQSIYQWRGASSDIIDLFMMDFPDAQRRGLTINHRTSAAVMRTWRNMAKSEQMPGLIDDYQISLRPGGQRPEQIDIEGSPNFQYAAIAEHVRNLIDSEQFQSEDIGILSRRRYGIERISEQLDARDIPHTILGDDQVERDPNQECVLAMLNLSVNPTNTWALRKAADCNVTKKRRNLNNIISRDIQTTALENNINLVEASEIIRGKINQDNAIYLQLDYTIKTWRELQEMMDANMRTSEMIRFVYDEMFRHGAGRKQRQISPQITKILTTAERTDRASSANVDARQRISLFLEGVANSTNPDEESEENQDPFAHRKGVMLGTMHASKGLQWPVVFIADCNADIIPGENTRENSQRMMEEQRLFYVAVTRSEDRLYLYTSEKTTQGGETAPTPFLEPLLA